MFRALSRTVSLIRPSLTSTPLAAGPRIALPSLCTALNPITAPTPLLGILGGVRFKGTHGREYQPSTIKRKRKFGFLARMTDRHGRKVIARRKAKGRWYLTH